LKKAKYLEDEPVEAAASPIEAGQPEPPVSAPPANKQPIDQPASLFAEKLQQAWRKEP
jgi:hypothetical protein